MSSCDAPPFSRLFVMAPKEATVDQLKDAFSNYGIVENIHQIKDKNGLCYIKFSKASSAALAMENLNGKKICGYDWPLKCLISNTKREGNIRLPNEESKVNRLFVRIAKEWNEDDLRKEFNRFGDIEQVKVVRAVPNGSSKGYGYVKYVKSSDACLALEECDPKFKAVIATLPPNQRNQNICEKSTKKRSLHTPSVSSTNSITSNPSVHKMSKPIADYNAPFKLITNEGRYYKNSITSSNYRNYPIYVPPEITHEQLMYHVSSPSTMMPQNSTFLPSNHQPTQNINYHYPSYDNYQPFQPVNYPPHRSNRPIIIPTTVTMPPPPPPPSHHQPEVEVINSTEIPNDYIQPNSNGSLNFDPFASGEWCNEVTDNLYWNINSPKVDIETFNDSFISNAKIPRHNDDNSIIEDIDTISSSDYSSMMSDFVLQPDSLLLICTSSHTLNTSHITSLFDIVGGLVDVKQMNELSLTNEYTNDNYSNLRAIFLLHFHTDKHVKLALNKLHGFQYPINDIVTLYRYTRNTLNHLLKLNEKIKSKLSIPNSTTIISSFTPTTTITTITATTTNPKSLLDQLSDEITSYNLSVGDDDRISNLILQLKNSIKFLTTSSSVSPTLSKKELVDCQSVESQYNLCKKTRYNDFEPISNSLDNLTPIIRDDALPIIDNKMKFGGTQSKSCKDSLAAYSTALTSNFSCSLPFISFTKPNFPTINSTNRQKCSMNCLFDELTISSWQKEKINLNFLSDEFIDRLPNDFYLLHSQCLQKYLELSKMLEETSESHLLLLFSSKDSSSFSSLLLSLLYFWLNERITHPLISFETMRRFASKSFVWIPVNLENLKNKHFRHHLQTNSIQIEDEISSVHYHLQLYIFGIISPSKRHLSISDSLIITPNTIKLNDRFHWIHTNLQPEKHSIDLFRLLFHHQFITHQTIVKDDCGMMSMKVKYSSDNHLMNKKNSNSFNNNLNLLFKRQSLSQPTTTKTTTVETTITTSMSLVNELTDFSTKRKRL
ncbi:hypothetical protein SNEBB_001347 [Seison nebaliae]|nr:hypothetical protein SNEBB_001347 [Seison nebaliae]